MLIVYCILSPALLFALASCGVGNSAGPKAKRIAPELRHASHCPRTGVMFVCVVVKAGNASAKSTFKNRAISGFVDCDPRTRFVLI